GGGGGGGGDGGGGGGGGVSSRGGGDGGEGDGSTFGGSSGSGRFFGNRIRSADQVVDRVAGFQDLCGIVGPYLIDCLAERFEALEKDLAGLPGHEPLRAILKDTARDLRQIARENRDPSKPRGKARSVNSTDKSHRPIVAVAPERQATAVAQALAVLEETQTKLLRSAESSPTRSVVRYQRIAAAIDSSKVLLRSV
ncbi:hypothetical protein, partial [Leisingera sp. ANG-S5]|uniref:hypothetical protein n=1 Tax=Leisingera sp. ANG-S5 TaxID=1577901 RepID=UPI000690362E